MKKKIVMSVYNNLKTDARVLRSAEALSENYEVHLLGLGGEHIEAKKYQVYDVKLSRNKNIFMYFEFIMKNLSFLKSNKLDVFYAHDYYTALIVLILMRIKPNVKVIYDAHELIIPEKSKKQNLREKIYYRLEKLIVNHIDLLITANEDRAILMTNHYKLNTKPLIIENISLLSNKIPEKAKAKYKKFDYFFEKDYLYIVYAGVLVKHREIDKLFSLVSESKIDTKVVIIGDGPDRERLINIAEKIIPNKYLFTGSLPHEEMGYMISKCDIGYLNYPNDSLNNIYSASNKVYEYASLNIPMFSNENIGLIKIFERTNIGIADNNLNIAFEKISRNIYKMKKNCSVFTENNKWENVSKKLNENVNKSIN